MSGLSKSVCPVCGVTILGKDKVIFSSGPPGTRAKLWARVCQYTQSPACINQEGGSQGPLQSSDFYPSNQPKK